MMFVAFEGAKGVGKSSTIAAVADELRRRGRAVVQETEPTSSPIGQLIRQVVNDVAPRTLALLVAADRSDHQDRLRELSKAGAVVLCDRYLLSSLALQLVDGLEGDWVMDINRWFIQPDMCVVLSAPPHVVAERRSRRGTVMDRFGDPAFLDRELDAIMCASATLRSRGWRVDEIDAARPAQEVVEDIVTAIERELRAYMAA